EEKSTHFNGLAEKTHRLCNLCRGGPKSNRPAGEFEGAQSSRLADSETKDRDRHEAGASARRPDMRRIALTAWGVALATAWAASAQGPASLGTPMPAAQLGKPVAMSPRIRGQAD